MKHETIIAVGIDVSKGKNTVAVYRPGDEMVLTPLQVEHDAAGLSGLQSQILVYLLNALKPLISQGFPPVECSSFM